jgi:protein TonB
VDVYRDRSVGQRAISLGIVVLIHVAVVIVIVTRTGALDAVVPPAAPVRLMASVTPRPPPPPPIKPLLPPPELLPVPIPEIVVAQPPPSSSVPRAITRARPAGPPVSHFGAASGDTGLGVAAATSGAGGARGRGNLGDFEAAVKRAILSRKVQPALAWDRRNTCVVNYTASIARDGSLAGMQIEPCAIAEINEAARAAIRQAAPFPVPPDLGARTYNVHGTLIFHP